METQGLSRGGRGHENHLAGARFIPAGKPFPITGVEPFTEGEQNVKRLRSSGIEISRETLAVEREIVVLEHVL